MRYNYTAYYDTDEERIKAIKEDILTEYPRLGELAELAATLEQPFGRVNEDYWQFIDYTNRINRLIDIVIVTENKPEFTHEYQKACQDLIRNYQYWKQNYTYASPEKQSEFAIMQRFYEHQKDKSKPLLTMNQADKIGRVERENEDIINKWYRDHTMRYNFTAYYNTDEERIEAITADILKEYPRLGELAREAARLETPFGQVNEDYWEFSNQRNHINRLIDIVIVTEDKPEFKVEHEKACRDLTRNFQSWQRGFTYSNPEEQPEYIVMQRYIAHVRDKSIPLITMEEAYNEKREDYENRGRRF